MDLVHVEALAPAVGADWREGDAFLAGGTWLFSEPQPALRRLLDLHAFDWPDLLERDDGLEIAATCTMTNLASRPTALIRQCCDALLGSFKVWHEATVGGNICLALPAGPMISLTAALDGVATLWSSGGAVRELPVASLVVGPQRTALEPGELLRSVFLPRAALDARHAFRQLSLSAYGRSAVLVIGRVDASGETVVTVTASTPRPVVVRWSSLPSSADARRSVAAAVVERCGWYDDVHGDREWREAMTARLVAEVVDELAAP